jgi:hypothetical protein
VTNVEKKNAWTKRFRLATRSGDTARLDTRDIELALGGI